MAKSKLVFPPPQISPSCYDHNDGCLREISKKMYVRVFENHDLHIFTFRFGGLPIFRQSIDNL